MNFKRKGKSNKNLFPIEIGSGTPRELPSDMLKETALNFNQNELAIERTEFAKIRTDLALANSRMSADRTHLSYLRTIVSLIGSGATLFETLPLLGVEMSFTIIITVFLLLFAGYFIYKDASTYPRRKRQLDEMEAHASELAEKTENQIFHID